MKAFIEEFDIHLYDGKGSLEIRDPLIQEVPLDIFLNDRKVITIACAGINIKDLAIGFLRSEGLIEKPEEMDTIIIDGENFRVDIKTGDRKFTGFHTDDSVVSIMSSGARKRRKEVIESPIESDLVIPAQNALTIMEELLTSSSLHKKTHGAHCSALADPDGIIAFRDDIGRHNTIDMLGGYAFVEKIDCRDLIMATTGRISQEIASKVFYLGIPIIISHSVPTSRAVKFSRDAGITIIGYVREGKMKIYSHERRVIL